MLLQYKYLFNFPKINREQMNDLLSAYHIEYRPSERPEETDLYYGFDLLNTMPNIDQFNMELEMLIPKISNIPVYQPVIEFIFDKTDYDSSPYFKLQATGNSGRAFIDSYKPKFDKNYLCHTCGVLSRNLISPLEINNSKIGKRLMVNVNEEYWVITEKLANLIFEWDLKGFELKDGISNNTNGQKLYQLIPKVIMPPLSNLMKYYFIDRREWCSNCDLRNWFAGPFQYDASALQNLQTDFAITNELNILGSLAYRPLLVSSRFRKLIIENKISKEVLNLRDPKYKSYDWFFEPIMVNEK